MLGELLDLAGGLMSNRQQKKNRAAAQGQFDQQMDHSVRRRVEDAKRAGIHPLFALGASVGSSPTMVAPSGSAMGDAVSRVGRRVAQKKHGGAMIRAAEASASRDEAEAALLNSERKKLELDLVSRGHDGASVKGDEVQFGPGKFEDVPVRRQEKIGVAAGTNALWIKQQNADGSEHYVVNPDLGMDEVGQVINAAKQLWYQGLKAIRPRWVPKEMWIKAWNNQKAERAKNQKRFKEDVSKRWKERTTGRRPLFRITKKER